MRNELMEREDFLGFLVQIEEKSDTVRMVMTREQ